MVHLLRKKTGCEGFNELISEIRDEASNGSYTYVQIGITEIELITLGLNNARLKCVRGSKNVFCDQIVVTRYSRQLAMLLKAAPARLHKAG